MTASTTLRLRSISSSIVSSIVCAASRYQAVTASCWPMRWQRSSAWSCIAGVHSRSRKATLEACVSVMPWPATRVAQTSSCDSPAWKRLHRRLARADRVAAEQVQRVREALDQPVLHLAVAGEDDERLVGREEVLDPRHRRVALAARGEPAQRVELREPLRAQRRGDLALELAQVERLLAQPRDHVLLGEPVVALVVERDRHGDLALGGQLRQHVGLRRGARSSCGAGASGSAPPRRCPGSGARSGRPSRSPPAGR